MSKTVTLRMDEKLYKKLRSLAKDDNRSLSNFIETATRRYVEQIEHADEKEMAAIRGNKELNESMERAIADYKAGRGRLV